MHPQLLPPANASMPAVQASMPRHGLHRLLRAMLRPISQRLDVRIVTLFLLLLLLVQAASFITIRFGIDANARGQIAVELSTGENVLRRLLQQNAQNLNEAARLLAADYGFRSAIAGGDRLTLVDALDNQAARIGASAALFTDAQFQPVASTLVDTRPVLALVQAAQRAPAGSAAHAVNVLDGKPFQLVTVPVKAPQLIGHVSMGFPLTAQLMADMEQISGLRTGLMVREAGGAWHILPIGGGAAALGPLTSQFAGAAIEAPVVLGGEHFGARVVMLGSDGPHEVAAVLMRSVDEAIAPYRQLQLTLGAITLLGLAIFGAGSVVTARRITGPIKALSASAMRLGAGDHSTPVTVDSHDEVHELAQSFETMRQGMQQREA